VSGFFKRIKQCFYDPEFYEREAVGGGLSAALKFYLGICALLALICGAVFLGMRGTAINRFADRIIPDTISAYPENLEIVIHNGVLKTNAPGPVKITWPRA